MDEMRRLDVARQEFNQAQERRRKAVADLGTAGIEAHAEIKGRKETMKHWAEKAKVSSSALSALATDKRHGRTIYEAIDKITDGRYRLALLRDEFDAAEKELERARTSVNVAEAAANASESRTTASASYAATPADLLLIDDVLVDRQADRVVLDIRLRNPGTRLVNVTTATVRILERKKFLAVYHPTADYDLLIEGDTNQVPVSHYIKSDNVDRFTLTLGFAQPEQGILFTAEVLLHFNGESMAVSKPITFDSCFG